ncbi:MAG TPA: hypothetical protein VK619_05730 [Pyrinomonadaceae bacterium]|nr:hypothetical protein [Pyrinomonadaceae bacterium]
MLDKIMENTKTKNQTHAPRPSSLRALLAWYFVLSYGDYKDQLIDVNDRTSFELRMRQLIWWPPDVFALTSTILARTGAYRMIVGPNDHLGENLWQRLDWQSRVEAHAEAWRSVISELILNPLPEDVKENSQMYADDLLWYRLGERVNDRCCRRNLLPLELSTSQFESEDRNYGSSEFQVCDFEEKTKAFFLCGQLKAGTDPLAIYLRDGFEPATRQRLEQYTTAQRPTRELLQTIADEFNKLLDRTALYKQVVFDKVSLRPETRELRERREKKELEGKDLDRQDLLRFNHLLLEDAYPQGIAKRQKYPPDLFETFIRSIIELEDDNGPLADQNLLAISVKADRRNKPDVGESEKNAARFFEAIIGLHILADAASSSIGVPRSSTQESAIFDAFANVLLTLRGSLSTASKFYGVVLPKMRTPQSGLTLRNLSHNLTFHDCEVEVMWRSFPWANFDENTLNVLYVPYPFDFDPNRFETETHHYESVGYFTYNPGDWDEINSVVVALIDKVRKRGINPHMLVFTETAFNENTYERLLRGLSQKYGSSDPQRMPIVVAGIAKKVPDGEEREARPYNELRLATYFAGKWYQLAQHKHHRWQLNPSQIRQYGLQGRLSTARLLFERSVIDQRRLTFFAPNPWLVLSPLICEDLSRIEPVSELIRGVGPTLVLALLLDGPQLADRWSARYASVLADDPGTGVLTVTSYGIAKESRASSPVLAGCPLTNLSNNDASKQDKVVVASWKDPSSSFKQLSASKDQALLVTLTANWGKEFTLDSRGISGKAAGFRLDGNVCIEMQTAKDLQGSDSISMQAAKDPQGSDCDPELYGNWSDIREVTALTYVASAALSLLRPHQSKHPEEKEQRTDTWGEMRKWNERCHRVRQLIDVMLGRPIIDKKRWDEKTKQEEVKQKADSSDEGSPKAPTYKYFINLEKDRNALLNHIFNSPDGKKRAPNRHLFAVLCFAQSTIDVEVRDDEAKWPTDSLRFGCTVLRILLDTIAGIGYRKELDLEQEDSAASKVYRSRLKIAGWANRLGKKGKDRLWDEDTVSEGDRDVRDAPEPLYIPSNDSQNTGRNAPIRYLRQFEKMNQSHSNGKPLGGSIEGHPTRYDFYRMILELVDAILEDIDASLWKQCQKIFKGDVSDTEMRRLTLLVLMMLPALIHEQIEFDYIRLKLSDEIGLSSAVLHNLMKKSEEILQDAAKKTRTPWRHPKN